MVKWLLGNLYLAYRATFVRPMRAVVEGKRGGIGRFQANYFPEGLIPTLPEDREMLAAAGRCISCGLCDAVDPYLADSEAGPYDGVSLLPRQYARSSVELGHALPILSRLDPESYREAEAVCPTGVPLVKIARWLKARASRTVMGAASP